MGTLKIVSTSEVKSYEASGDGFVAYGNFTKRKSTLSELNGTVYNEDFMKTYIGGFEGKRNKRKMEYKTYGDKEKVENAIGIIENYIKLL